MSLRRRLILMSIDGLNDEEYSQLTKVLNDANLPYNFILVNGKIETISLDEWKEVYVSLSETVKSDNDE